MYHTKGLATLNFISCGSGEDGYLIAKDTREGARTSEVLSIRF